ncbi:hypothetical protein CE91St46_03000 [Eubacteriales bacterium]|nr:hypothetical protein [Faecalicatena sp. BF-R-105]GKH49189.1 hypothetical protein CE91St46_03000 [Eubacteriales bacterium]GKH61830.1 hypothetical protein CE91St47_02990 [Eubacteriales bacterium]
MVRLLHAIIGEDGRMIDRGRELQLPAAREEMLVRGGFARKIPAMENPEFAEAAAPMFADRADAGTAPEGTGASDAGAAGGAAAPEDGAAVEEPAGPFVMEAGEKPLGRRAK